MEKQPDIVEVRIVVEVVDPFGIERTCTADDAVDFIPLFEKEFGEIGTILACDPGDDCSFHVRFL